MTKRPRKALFLLVALIMALALPATAVVAQESGTLVAEGFNAPQGILVDPDGNIWVIDSGVGGDTEFEMLSPETGEMVSGTYGETARVVKIAPDGTQTEVATLPSVFVGEESIGGARLALVDGVLYATSGGWIGDGAENPPPTIPNMAAVVSIGEDGTVTEVAPTWRLEKRMNPDYSILESHPYGLAAAPDGRLWVADAGGNTILRVNPATSAVELITTFPAIPGVFPNPNRGGEMLTDPVPTGIAFDDDGNAYVSLLSGAPFVPGSASVVMVSPSGEQTDVATNLTMLTDIRRGPDGAFYAVQFAVFTDQGPTPNSGAIIKIGEGETSEPVVTGLSFPTSIDFDADGNVYVTINGVGAPGSGAVVMYEGVGAGETYLAAAATMEPTAEPTMEPTEEPTEEPTAEPTAEAAMAEMPVVVADDQVSDGMQVIVAKVVAAQDGWIVIHADADGKPGPVLGQTAVAAGETENVIVMLDAPIEADSALWAMLHVDEGVRGSYEFPGPDGPAQVDGAAVIVPFTAMGDATTEAMAEPTEEMTEEAMAEPTEEMTEEAMAEPTEEMMEEAMAEGEKGAPSSLPNTGAALPSIPSVIAIVMGVLAALAGGVSLRRRK